MAQPKFKAPDQGNAIPASAMYRDTRTTFQQLTDGFKSPVFFGGCLAMLGGTPLFMPEMTFPAFFLGWIIYFLRMNSSKKEHLPFRMPFTSLAPDYGDPKPGRRGFSQAAGTFLLGNTFGIKTVELWLGIRDMLTHMLIFGTTGSGKTEALVSLSFNSMAMGSGLFYVDPKGSPKLIAQLYVMSRICGRDDDFRCINYLTAEKGAAGTKMPLRTTNMINPFSYGNAESLSNMLNSLIPKSEGGNAIFSANARNLMKSVMYALVEMRDKGEIQLSSKTIRDYLTLSKVMALAERNDFSRNTTDALRAFLTSVGWQEGKDEKSQPKSLSEQFGYARSYFGDPLNNLTDTYGHVYNTPFGEIDMRDVVMNRRILAIIIPSLAMAQEEVKSLGVISLSAIRIAIAVGLGTGKEGQFSDILYSLPTDAPAPFLSITDEYAAIPTPGYVEVLTQGRGLGISAIVASQDFAGITKADKEGAQQLLENTKVKLFMKCTDGGETFDVAKRLAGEITLMESSGFNIKPDSTSMFSDYRDTLNANPKDRNRIALSDLQNQIEGEFHAFLGSTLVRGKTFYADPPLPADFRMQYSHMVSVYPPEKKEIENRFKAKNQIVNYFIDQFANLPEESNDDSQNSRITDRENQLIQAFETSEYLDLKPVINFNEIIRETMSHPLESSMETVVVALVRLHNQIEHERKSEPEPEMDESTGQGDASQALDDAEIFGGMDDDFNDNDNESDPVILESANSNSAFLNELEPYPLEVEQPIYGNDEFEFEDENLSEVSDIEAKRAAMVDDIAKLKAKVTADQEYALQMALNMKQVIANSHPVQPSPKNDKKTKDLLSARLNTMIKNATEK
jgi:intracellular multiplication protein IcmO